MTNVGDSDFYEEDEPAEEIRAIFESSDKGLTGQTHGWTQTLDVFGGSVSGGYFSSHTNSAAGRLVNR